MRYVVLLKNGTLEIAACSADGVFALASIHQAGICGVFVGYKEAEAYIAEMSSAQRKERLSSSGSGLPTVPKY